MCSSLSCSGVTGLGGIHHLVAGGLNLGGAITSRIFGSSLRSIIRRSTLGAIPPCGGAP